jgi:hypothetical protein
MHLAFDTETWLIAPGRLAPKMVCVSWFDGTNGGLLDREDGLEFMRNILLDPDITIVGQNVAFDMGVLGQNDPTLMPLIWDAYDAGRVRDTMIYEMMWMIECGWNRIDPMTGRPPDYSLAGLVKKHLLENVEGKAGEEAWRFRYRELDGVPIDKWPKEASSYAYEDARYTWRVWEKQHGKDIPNLNFQTMTAWSLHLMSAWGLRTDPKAVDVLEKSLAASVFDAIAKLKANGVYRAEGTKDLSVVRELVRGAYGGNPPLTAKGSVSTSAQVLEESDNPILQCLAGISGDQKLLNTFIPILKRGTEYPVNPRFNVLVASGRTSCRNPNLQNQPRKGGVRECYVPREGWVYVACDYHIAELCSLAQVLLDKFGYSKMAEALQEGRELHLETAAGILGITYSEAVSRHSVGDEEVKEARQLAKALNFGLPGGLGAASFKNYAKASFGVDVTEDEARELKEKWLNRYPEMSLYFREIADRCADGGGSFVAEASRTLFRRGGVGFCDGANFQFQHLTSAGAKAALYAVVRECYHVENSSLFGSRAVAFIHDEILLESPEEKAHSAAKRLSEIMVERMKTFLPDIPVSADAHLMDRWYKNAGPVFDENGELTVWRPTNGDD